MDSTQRSETAGTSQVPQDEGAITVKLPQSQCKKFDPLDVLPEETWIAIIAESASEMHGYEIVISQDTLLDLMQVSRLWNIQISSSPTLWVDIILEDKYDAAAKAYLALHYSKHASLALYMHYPTGWWDTLQEQIMANRARITGLFIYNPRDGSFIDTIVRQLSPLPSLAGLHYTPFYTYRISEGLNYLSDSPISSVDVSLDRGMLEERNAWKLRTIFLKCELNDVFDLLEGSEYLQEVMVSPRVSVWEDEHREKIEDSFLQGRPLPWKRLTYYSAAGSFLAATIARLPNVIHLQIDVSEKTFCSLMPLIFQLENLYIFNVTLRGKWDRFERLVIPQASASIRDASISIESDIYPVMDPVVDALLRSLANIQHLRLRELDLPTIRMLTSSAGFQHLHSIRISISDHPGDTRFNTDEAMEPFPTSVERVSYWMNGTPLKSLIPHHSHYIKHLEISDFPLFKMNLYSWTAIRTINLRSNTIINWKGPTYQYLHTITFKPSLSVTASPKGRNVTKLCRDIALNPEYFPAVKKLEFGACPELDILFILLETRNVAIQPGVSPILTLVIPTRYPPLLVERLRDLVKGVKHSALSYYDLSIAGNYDIIMDPSITGCAECHRALRFCAHPLENPGAQFPPLMLEEYPESVTEILESWDARAEQWYPVEETLRHGRCKRSFPLVSITR